ncbi:MAG: hypothetical protein Q9M28_10935, partial [Mariprofundaceae bacterium]|nr:hypothetical protein [Mariprofundaceae bacterium]
QQFSLSTEPLQPMVLCALKDKLFALFPAIIKKTLDSFSGTKKLFFQTFVKHAYLAPTVSLHGIL